MSDTDALVAYRMEQAQSTLADAVRMLEQGFSPRSIVNRACYAMFYSVLALFLKTGAGVHTSKHAGVIAAFDREFVIAGKMDRKYSRMLHSRFDARLEADYKEMVIVGPEDAAEAVEEARLFVEAVRQFADLTRQPPQTA